MQGASGFAWRRPLSQPSSPHARTSGAVIVKAPLAHLEPASIVAAANKVSLCHASDALPACASRCAIAAWQWLRSRCLSLVVLVVGSGVAPSLIGTFNAVSAGSLADTDPQPGASYDRAAQPPLGVAAVYYVLQTVGLLLAWFVVTFCTLSVEVAAPRARDGPDLFQCPVGRVRVLAVGIRVANVSAAATPTGRRVRQGGSTSRLASSSLPCTYTSKSRRAGETRGSCSSSRLRPWSPSKETRRDHPPHSDPRHPPGPSARNHELGTVGMVPAAGFEPATPSLRTWCSTI